jgi:enoyl-CoA hydratase/carnithine racemase
MYEQIRYEVESYVATLTLSRPERLNAWTDQMGQEIMHALASAERDPGVVAIVLTGAGRGFCSGADLSTLSAISQGKASAEQGLKATQERPGEPDMGPSFRGPFSYPMSILKPVIGALNGPCFGLGMAIALSCDIRIASDRASFSTAFARRGLVAEWGVSWTLPRIVGVAHAMDLLLSARTVGAEEAERMGLVNRVVPHEDLTRAAREYAEDIATNCAPESLAVIKRDVLQHLTGTLHQAEQDAQRHMAESFSRADFREGLASLAEKRSPRFARVGGGQT